MDCPVLRRLATEDVIRNVISLLACLMKEIVTLGSILGRDATPPPMDCPVLMCSKMENVTQPATMRLVCLMAEIVRMRTPRPSVDQSMTATAVRTTPMVSVTPDVTMLPVVGTGETVMTPFNIFQLMDLSMLYS